MMTLPDTWNAYVAWGNTSNFKSKIRAAQDIIQQSLSLGQGYVSISWGKDSIVLLHLVQQVCPNIVAISLGHPKRELISNYAEVESNYCQRFPTKLTTIMIPGDHVPDKIKNLQLWQNYPIAFVGLRAEESKGRKKSLQVHGMIYKYQGDRGYRVCPLAYWSEFEIWSYIALYDLPYLEAYDNGSSRTTDHISLSTNSVMQATRLEEFKRYNIELYNQLNLEMSQYE